jgi:dipeptidyl aminopeptidase/acylaminoacyl peptidase
MGSDLFVLSPATGALVNLTASVPLVPTSLAWSPDSTRIAVGVELPAPDFGFDLYAVPLDLGPPELLTLEGPVTDGMAFRYAWEPTGAGAGARLLYTGDPEVAFRRDLYVVDADGSGHQRINSRAFPVSPNAAVTNAQWAPDGGRVAYLYDPQVGAFRLLSWAHGTQQEVSGLAGMDRSVETYAWSPDGDRLAFTANKADPMAEDLHVVGEAGGPVVPLTAVPAGQYVGQFAWAPDGESLVYNAYVGNADPANYALRRVAATGGGSVLLHPHSAISPRWSALGSNLAFVADAYLPADLAESLRVWVAPGGASPFEATMGFPLDPMVDAELAGWSPTGEHLLLRVSAPSAADAGLFHVAVAGGAPVRLTAVGEPAVAGAWSGGWSPTGRSVAWIVDDGTPLDGGPLRRAALDGGAEDALDGLPPATQARAFAWR